MQSWNKRPSFKGVATSEDGEDILQDLEEDHGKINVEAL
jgi:hypothetical protein